MTLWGGIILALIQLAVVLSRYAQDSRLLKDADYKRLAETLDVWVQDLEAVQRARDGVRRGGVPDDPFDRDRG